MGGAATRERGRPARSRAGGGPVSQVRKRPLFHSRMIRPPGRGRYLFETPLFRPVSGALSHGPDPSIAPHRISLRHSARLLRLPLKGGVIEFYRKPCAGLKHSPLEGESVRQGLRPQSNRWGGRNRRDCRLGDPAQRSGRRYSWYCSRERTSTSGRRPRPLRNSSSTRKAAPTTWPPNRRTSRTVAAAVPPVASRSSTSRTR